MVVAETLELLLRQRVRQETEDLHIHKLYVCFFHFGSLLQRILVRLAMGRQLNDAFHNSQVTFPFWLVLKFDILGRYLILYHLISLLIEFIVDVVRYLYTTSFYAEILVLRNNFGLQSNTLQDLICSQIQCWLSITTHRVVVQPR